MFRYFKVICILGCLFLSACQIGSSPDDITPTTETSTARIEYTVSPSQTLSPAPTIAIQTVLPNPTVSSDVTLPALYYFLDNKLYEQVGNPPGEEIADLPDAGPILGAFQTGNRLLVMREQGIQRIKLSDGTTDMIFKFDKPGMYGYFISARDGQNIFFTTAVDDPQAEFSTANKVGFYDLNLDTITPVITIPDRVRILGQTEDNLGLYLLFFGMDTALGRIFLVDIQKGEIIKELAFQGELIASLAPDGCLLATLYPNYDPTENNFGVYDLTSLPETPPRIFILPNAPSQIYGSFYWSPDSRILYFNLLSGYFWEDPAGFKPYGLWQLDIATGEMSLLSYMADAAFYLERITTDGEWMLLRGRDAIWVNAHTGAQKAIGLPENAILVGGQ